MRFLCGGLMSAPPERPCDDIGGLNAFSRETLSYAADFISRARRGNCAALRRVHSEGRSRLLQVDQLKPRAHCPLGIVLMRLFTPSRLFIYYNERVMVIPSRTWAPLSSLMVPSFDPNVRQFTIRAN
jgi:hypothetical protein